MPMSSPRQVLLLTEESGVGGVQTTLHWLESGLTARGWQVTRLPVRRGRPSLWACWQAARRAQVLVASNNFRPAYAAVALAWLARRPSVVWVHGPLHEVLQQAEASRLKTAWLRTVYRRASQLVCASQTSCDSLLRVMADARCATLQHLRVIRNPAVLPGAGQDDAAMPTTTSASEVIALGFVGRLSPEKQPLQLLPMLLLLPAACQLHVVGDGELMGAMRSAGQDLLTHGRLHLHGQQTVSAQTYQAWRATVLCSRYEGYPMTALESLACGVPCVSTPIPAMQEMLGTQAPLWLAHDDSPAALAQAVQRCLAQAPADRQVAIDLLQQQHRLETFVQAWDQVLTGLLQRRGQGQGPKQGPRQGHGAVPTDASREDTPSGGRP
ncbi:glycosyltransferase [Limnohabitans sp. 2KL-3]|uniref:glycosyltransferase n=1 Tax=Limnohabitans sp. 2KL-3 TaxID=1100700 RepID=UPI000A40686F|nr:glycosyltransferase [Limnohabitans sp. 2KL-3]